MLWVNHHAIFKLVYRTDHTEMVKGELPAFKRERNAILLA